GDKVGQGRVVGPRLHLRDEVLRVERRLDRDPGEWPDRKSTRLHSSHTVISTLPLHAALPISVTRLARAGLSGRVSTFVTKFFESSVALTVIPASGQIGRAHVCTPVTQ